MIHIVVAAHADLAEGLVHTAETITGPAEGLHAVSLLPEDSPERFAEKLSAVLETIAGQETLILVDLFGGTPFNVAARRVLPGRVECVSGANLPMLLEAILAREGVSLAELTESIAQAGRESVRNVGALLGGRGEAVTR